MMILFLKYFSLLKMLAYYFQLNHFLKDTQKEKVPSNKTPAITKSMNMDILVVGTSNQLFARNS